MKYRNAFKKYGPKLAVAAVTMAAVPAFAADIDTAESLGYIAAGVVAAIAIGGAMLGLVALIGVGKKTQRAGT